MNFPKKLIDKLDLRKENKTLRSLDSERNLIDFSSNDYLGFANSEIIFDKTHQFLINKSIKQNGATGSRLLSGNHNLYNQVEEMLCNIHQSESATIFNSGYDANLGLFSSIPQRGDVIIYDEFIHASIRDGIQLSNAKAYKFSHNDVTHLDEMLKRFKQEKSELFVVTETVFSMDGDSPDLEKIVAICKKHNAFLIVDEAHAVGVFDYGIVQQLNLETNVFARVITFGKALGCHSAVILGSNQLHQYLINFARSFIYTTALSPHSLATIKSAYETLVKNKEHLKKLQENIEHFVKEVEKLHLNFIESSSSIHCCIIGGNEQTKSIANQLKQNGFDVKPILSPTVPKNKERLRFCIHSFNSKEQISEVLHLLSTFVNQ